MRRQAREKDRRTVFNMFSRGYSQKEIAAISELPLKKYRKCVKGLSRIQQWQYILLDLD